MRRQSDFPAGWDETRVQRVLDHYENQTDEGAAADDEASLEDRTETLMEVQVDLARPSVG